MVKGTNETPHGRRMGDPRLPSPPGAEPKVKPGLTFFDPAYPPLTPTQRGGTRRSRALSVLGHALGSGFNERCGNIVDVKAQVVEQLNHLVLERPFPEHRAKFFLPYRRTSLLLSYSRF